MKSITIHGLNDQLDHLIRKRAKKHGLSLNKTIKYLLEESLGIKKEQYSDHRDEFMDLFGIWSKADRKEFSDRIKDFEIIDETEWPDFFLNLFIFLDTDDLYDPIIEDNDRLTGLPNFRLINVLFLEWAWHAMPLHWS